MSRHMQKILLKLAERVSVGVIIKRNSNLDQEYLVYERKSEKNRDEDYLKELYDYESRFNNSNNKETPKKKNNLAHLITKECYKSKIIIYYYYYYFYYYCYYLYHFFFLSS